MVLCNRVCVERTCYQPRAKSKHAEDRSDRSDSEDINSATVARRDEICAVTLACEQNGYERERLAKPLEGGEDPLADPGVLRWSLCRLLRGLTTPYKCPMTPEKPDVSQRSWSPRAGPSAVCSLLRCPTGHLKHTSSTTSSTVCKTALFRM